MFKAFSKEFKEFAVKGSVIDMAVGIIIGGAFGTIAKSLVTDIIMPPIGLLLDGVNFSDLFIILKGGTGEKTIVSLADAKAAGAVTINYGLFLTSIVSFLIVALTVFFVVKQINKLKKEAEAPPTVPTTRECPHCCTDIPIKAMRCPNCTSQLNISKAT